MYVYQKKTFTPEFLQSGIFDYDFVMLPNYLARSLDQLPKVDLMVNMQSFQEMATSQVEEYLNVGSRILSGYLYSNNIDRHPYNEEDVNITKSLQKYFKLFPDPETYARPFLNSRVPWYYKFYFGIPKQSSRSFPEGAKIMIRIYAPESPVSSTGNYPVSWHTLQAPAHENPVRG